MATSSISVTTRENRKRIDRLFLQFAAMYGQVWRCQFKNDDFIEFAKAQWVEGLADFDDRILDQAIELCRRNLQMPPTLPKFFDFCNCFYKQRSFVKPEPVPRNPVSEVGRENLRQIRTFLNMKTN